jgi:hypothetical protein
MSRRVTPHQRVKAWRSRSRSESESEQGVGFRRKRGVKLVGVDPKPRDLPMARLKVR